MIGFESSTTHIYAGLAMEHMYTMIGFVFCWSFDPQIGFILYLHNFFFLLLRLTLQRKKTPFPFETVVCWVVRPPYNGYTNSHIFSRGRSVHLLLSLNLVCGFLDVLPVDTRCVSSLSTAMAPRLSVGKMYSGDKTHLTKFSSSLLFALIGGVVGSSAFFPPIESAAPVNVVASVAIASYTSLVSHLLHLLVHSTLDDPPKEQREERLPRNQLPALQPLN